MTSTPATEPIARPMRSSVIAARPMFSVLKDDSQLCVCHVYGGEVCSAIAMRVTAADYRRPGQVFL